MRFYVNSLENFDEVVTAFEIILNGNRMYVRDFHIENEVVEHENGEPHRTGRCHVTLKFLAEVDHGAQ
jgi:hypothetical protein